MRIIFWYMEKFNYHPAIKNLEDAPAVENGAEITEAIVAFVHAEAEDQEKASKVETKLVKNLKWLAGKWQCKTLVLHSFAHLSESKSAPEFLQQLFDSAQQRLEGAGYRVHQTPFGYFLDIEIVAPGKSLARVYKEF